MAPENLLVATVKTDRSSNHPPLSFRGSAALCGSVMMQPINLHVLYWLLKKIQLAQNNAKKVLDK